MHFIKRVSDTTKGIFLIIMGVVLLLQALGMLSVSLNFVTLFFAVALIAAGVYLIRDKVSVLLKNNTKK